MSREACQRPDFALLVGPVFSVMELDSVGEKTDSYQAILNPLSSYENRICVSEISRIKA